MMGGKTLNFNRMKIPLYVMNERIEENALKAAAGCLIVKQNARFHIHHLSRKDIKGNPMGLRSRSKFNRSWIARSNPLRFPRVCPSDLSYSPSSTLQPPDIQ